MNELPDEVKKWASNDKNIYDEPTATFAFIPRTNVTIFKGSEYGDEKKPNLIWTTTSTSYPICHEEYSYVNQFIAVSESYVCFQSDNILYSIYCTDGIEFRKEQFDESSSRKQHDSHVSSFYTLHDGTLWYKERIVIQHKFGESGMIFLFLFEKFGAQGNPKEQDGQISEMYPPELTPWGPMEP